MRVLGVFVCQSRGSVVFQYDLLVVTRWDKPMKRKMQQQACLKMTDDDVFYPYPSLGFHQALQCTILYKRHAMQKHIKKLAINA